MLKKDYKTRKSQVRGVFLENSTSAGVELFDLIDDLDEVFREERGGLNG